MLKASMRSVIAFIGQLLTGLRYRLLLLVLLVCAPLVGMTLHTAWQSRREAMGRFRTRHQRMVQLAAREDEKLVGETRQLLLAVAESAPVRSANPQACHNYLMELLGGSSRYANFGVLTTNGQVLACAVPVTDPINVTDRGFLHRALESRGMAMGDYASLTGSGKATVDFGYPVLDPDGQVKAVVFASLDLAWANRLASELPAQLPRGATWTEIDSRGRILVRYPRPELWAGRPLPERGLLGALLEEPQGIVEAPDRKGVPNVYAYAGMPSRLVAGNVVTILGIPRQVLFADADRAVVRDLTALGVSVVIALTMGWLGSNFLILRPVKALVISSARLASGDLSART